LLANFDVITDYSIGDLLDVVGAATTLSASDGTVATLTAAAIQGVLTTGSFSAATVARAFTATGYSGTFVAINNGTAGFQAGGDAVIFLQGYTISAGNTVSIV
jgi:hypothetical protein